jgi:hypothetical protein
VSFSAASPFNGLGQACADARGKVGENTQVSAVCLGYSSSTTCYGLQPGDYCLACQLDFFNETFQDLKGLVVLGKFLDARGMLAQTVNDCLAFPARAQAAPQLQPGSLKLIRTYAERPGVLMLGIDLVPVRATLQIHSSLINLAAAKSFVGVAALTASPDQPTENVASMRWFTSLVPGPGRSVQGRCELVEEAVQRHLASATPKSGADENPQLVGSPRKKPQAGQAQGTPRGTYWKTVVGSILLLEENSNRQVKVTYVRVPPQYVAQYGIEQGATAFEGRRAGSQVSGNAVAFLRRDCRISYPMELTIQDGGMTIVTNANAPTVDAGCNIMKNSPASFTWNRIENTEDVPN